MRCPYCDIAFSPAFTALQAQYHSHRDIWSQVHTQYCPECRSFIVGVYEYRLGDAKFLNKDNYDEYLKLFVPIDHRRLEVKT